jgi:predicted metal-binding membrane protein
MNGMTGPESWSDALAAFVAMWMAGMVPMMLPSLTPGLARYRHAVRGVNGMPLHRLTAMVGVGYFTIWALLGAVAFIASTAVVAADSCSGLMVALLAAGMMNPVAMALVALAITAERLAPAPQWVERLAGLAIVVVGVLTVARI